MLGASGIHGAVSLSKELPDVDPVDLTSRMLQASKPEQAKEMQALLPAGADDDGQLNTPQRQRRPGNSARTPYFRAFLSSWDFGGSPAHGHFS